MNEMKKTRNLLMAIFCGFLAIAAILYIGGEFLMWDMAFLAEPSRQTQFLCSTMMILLTIGLLPLSLRLFRFRRVNDDLLDRKADALKKWGVLRLMMLGLLLVVNTILYYAFAFDSTYGYLAVVVMLCMPFVVPTMKRCLSEVEPPLAEKPEEDDELQDGNSDEENIQQQDEQLDKNRDGDNLAG